MKYLKLKNQLESKIRFLGMYFIIIIVMILLLTSNSDLCHNTSMKKQQIDKMYRAFDEGNHPVQTRIALPMKMIHGLREKNLEEVSRKNGYTHSELEVLVTLLVNSNGIRAKDISEYMIITSGGMSKVINKLLEKGLIEKKVLESDKRNSLLYITQEGTTVIQKIRPLFTASLMKQFEMLTPHELQTMENIFKKMLYANVEGS